MELLLTMENYGTVEKKLLHYGQNYGTIPRTMELRFTKENFCFIF